MNLPIDISDFKELREKNCYYVDKSLFIDEILTKGYGVYSITRPIGFGKSINLSMLRYFLDIKDSESNRKLFSGLKIEKSKQMVEFGKYPVVYISMKEVVGESYLDFENSFKNMIKKVYNEHSYIRESLDERDRFFFDEYSQGKSKYYKSAIKNLGILLKEYYNKEPVLIIDDYDVPYIVASKYGYCKDGGYFIDSFYGMILKEGGFDFCVIAGKIQTISDSYNNISVESMLDKSFNYFGVSESECLDLLKACDLESKLDDVKEWYGQYGKKECSFYNTRSLMKYCHYKELKRYFQPDFAIDENYLLQKRELIENSIQEFLSKDEVSLYFSEYFYTRENLDRKLYSYLFFAGYFTQIAKDEYKGYGKIPNREVREFLEELMKKYKENTIVKKKNLQK